LAFKKTKTSTMKPQVQTTETICAYSEIMGTACPVPTLPLLIDSWRDMSEETTKRAMFGYYLVTLDHRNLEPLMKQLERFVRLGESCMKYNADLENLAMLLVELQVAHAEAGRVYAEFEDWENEIEDAPRPFYSRSEWRSFHLENTPRVIKDALGWR